MHKIFHATKDAWISSGSNTATTGISERDQNFGKDQVLELKKVMYGESFDSNTRILVQFDTNEIKNYVSESNISAGTYSASLRLYEANGTQGLPESFDISIHPISMSWDEGLGKIIDDPKTTQGVSYENRRKSLSGDVETAWPAGWNGGIYMSQSAYTVTQSFNHESPDINADITKVLQAQMDGTIENYGYLIRLSGSRETTSGSFEQLKYFSSDTHTIYNPKIEFKYDDHVVATGSVTGSLNQLDVTGATDNILYKKGFRQSYKADETIKFRLGARARYISKTFSTSVQETSGSYIPEGSGSYSIVDQATGETVVPFSSFTTMSCDTTSPYFIQDMAGFYPQRVYKILVKIDQDDGQKIIYDDNFEFTVV
tara:strand:- start:1131 stop:2243 length:1113 start_codon:yes stop_codon:yes gene_type:complete